MSTQQSMIPSERIENAILMIRGHKVMLDSELARLYQVETKALVRAVHRNLERFPDDFMFQLDASEASNLRYQFGTSKSHGGRRHRPYAFTEQGVAMISGVLRSPRAIQVNIEIMRAFVRQRRILDASPSLGAKVAALEKKYDARFKVVFDALRKLMEPDPDPPKPTSGFAREPQSTFGFRRADSTSKCESAAVRSSP
jgi:hypothetical protein